MVKKTKTKKKQKTERPLCEDCRNIPPEDYGKAGYLQHCRTHQIRYQRRFDFSLAHIIHKFLWMRRGESIIAQQPAEIIKIKR